MRGLEALPFQWRPWCQAQFDPPHLSDYHHRSLSLSPYWSLSPKGQALPWVPRPTHLLSLGKPAWPYPLPRSHDSQKIFTKTNQSDTNRFPQSRIFSLTTDCYHLPLIMLDFVPESALSSNSVFLLLHTAPPSVSTSCHIFLLRLCRSNHLLELYLT